MHVNDCFVDAACVYILYVTNESRCFQPTFVRWTLRRLTKKDSMALANAVCGTFFVHADVALATMSSCRAGGAPLPATTITTGSSIKAT
mmetsp:Transcript_65462/g.153156  ORF Transcript_65462/g.153156 Transcript_65462/m.153156 type:complete len:89 (+) Transcript_65462:264-530(+)